MTEEIWPQWYRRFCLRMAVLAVAPFMVAYHHRLGRHDEADIWSEVGWSLWKTGSTKEILTRYDL